MVEDPRWQDKAHELALPHWGTSRPLTLADYFSTPVYGSFGRTHIDEYVMLEEFNLAGVPTDVVPAPNRRFPVYASAHEAREPYYESAAHLFSHVMRAFRPDGNVRVADMRKVVETIAVIPRFLLLRSDDPVKNGEIDPLYFAASQMAQGVVTVFLNDDLTPQYPFFNEKAIDDYYRGLLKKSAFENAYLNRSCPASPRQTKSVFRYMSLLTEVPEDAASFSEVLDGGILERVKKLGQAEYRIFRQHVEIQMGKRVFPDMVSINRNLTALNLALGREAPSTAATFKDVAEIF